MNFQTLIGLFGLLVIGVVLNSNEKLPEEISNMGGLLALGAGVGFTLLILKLMKVFR